MKLMRRRAMVLLVLAVFFTAGMTLFTVSYVTTGANWARHYSNDHLFTDGVMTVSGTIYDRNGEPLFQIVDGNPVYSEDKNVRKATLHAVGDGFGNINTSAQTAFRDQLTGISLWNGAYRYNGKISHRMSDLTLTLDASLCKTAYEALNGQKGTVGVYNYQTGEILCMVSTPTFDPANKPKFDPEDPRYEGVYLNRLLSGLYTPGSVFKLVTAACAIDHNPEILTQTFECDGEELIDGQEVTCPEVHGTVSFEEALADSCNLAFAKITLAVGAENLTEYADLAGVNESLLINGIPSAVGHFDVSDAAECDLAWAGIGQYTDTVNPLNLMAYMGAIANEGVRVTPSLLVPKPYSIDALANRFFTEEEKILSVETANTLKELMRNDVVNGYGDAAYEGLSLCAKTGTAQIGDDANPHAWFAGFLDREDAPLAFVVVVENGNSGIRAAAPVAAKVLKAAVSE